jgi:uncharacterized membrane protein YphA (DoxX/SURF4 family)
VGSRKVQERGEGMRLMEAVSVQYEGRASVPDREMSLAVTDWRLIAAEPWQSKWHRSVRQVSNCAGTFLNSRYAVLAMRVALAAVFLLSACGKLVDIRQYSISPILEFGILPSWVVSIVGSALPFIELLCALGLLFGVLTRLSSFGIAAMSAIFFLVKAFLLLQGYDLACGCFGAVVTTRCLFRFTWIPRSSSWPLP